MLARLLFCAGGFGNTASVVLLVNMQLWILAQEFVYKLKMPINQKRLQFLQNSTGKSVEKPGAA